MLAAHFDRNETHAYFGDRTLDSGYIGRVSYQVFARKYRPKVFDDVLGQDHVVQTLKNAIQQRRLAHAYLFVGPRGTGKTSMARILAKAVNCVHGPTVNPCGICDSCREIAEGISLDVLEIDGASNNSVDQIRELRENVRFAPRGRYKIYIIDEVHMLTQQAFNALLKTLEEPPAHVIFIFATTEPHKVLPTILSRCQRFDLRRIPALTIAKHLEFIAGQEGVKLEQEAAAAIAAAAEGGLRDAESMLDQLVAFCGNSITEAQVLEVFGLTAEHVVADLTRAILQQNAAGALAIVHQQSEAGKDLTKLLADLLSFLRNLLIFKIDPQSLREELSEHARATLDELAPGIEPAKLLRLIETTSEIEATIRWASNKKLHLEIALIRAIQTLGEIDLKNVIDALENLRGGPPRSEGEPLAIRPKETPEEWAKSRVERALNIAHTQSSEPAEKAVPEGAATKLTDSQTPHSELGEADWSRVLEIVRSRRPLVISWLEPAKPLFLEPGKLKLAFPADKEIAIESLSRPNNRRLLEEIAAEILGGEWEIEFELRDDLPPRGTTATEPPESSDPIDEFRKDPMIQKALELFKAEIQAER